MHLVRSFRLRPVVQAFGVALLLTAFCWYLGASVWYAILLGAGLTTLGWIGSDALSSPDLADPEWAEPARPDHTGARDDIVRLAMSLRGRRGRVGGAAVWRLQQIAQHRLIAFELDLGNPDDRAEISQLLGAKPYSLLAGPRGRAASRRSFLRCLDAVEALEHTQITSRARAARREPTVDNAPHEESP
jgi:hypothetical protein